MFQVIVEFSAKLTQGSPTPARCRSRPLTGRGARLTPRWRRTYGPRPQGRTWHSYYFQVTFCAIRRPGAAARRRRRPSPPTRRARRTLVPVRRRNVSISRRKAGGEGRGSDEGQHPVGGLEPQPSAAQAGLNLPPIYTCKGEHAGHAAGEVFGRERQRRVGSFMLQVLSAHDLDPPGSYAGSSLPRHRVYACPAPTL